MDHGVDLLNYLLRKLCVRDGRDGLDLAITMALSLPVLPKLTLGAFLEQNLLLGRRRSHRGGR